ncbi:MAG: restriction endonuclease [Desulfurococcaceae archaeon]
MKIYHGIKEEEARKLLSYLNSSGLMLELYYRTGTRSGNYYSIFVFPALCLTDEVIILLKPTKPLLLSPPPPAPEVVRTSRPTKEILERIVGSVLEDLGFKVYINVKRAARTGGPIEVDVWAEKDVGPMRFSVYVLCKNWDWENDRSVIDEEFGRTLNLRDQPQLKVIVAKRLTEPAKEVAISDGFLVIELGRKAEAETATEAYELVYETLNRLFMATTPPRLLEIASRVWEIAEELGRIKDELTELMKRPGVK